MNIKQARKETVYISEHTHTHTLFKSFNPKEPNHFGLYYFLTNRTRTASYVCIQEKKTGCAVVMGGPTLLKPPCRNNLHSALLQVCENAATTTGTPALETFKNGGCHPQTPLRPAPFARSMVGVFHLVVVHSLPLIVAGGGVRKEHRRRTVVDHTMRISTTQQSARLLCWFRKSRGVSHSTPRSFS